MRSSIKSFVPVLLITVSAFLQGCGGSGGPSTPTTPTITWATPTAITYGIAIGPKQLNATASVAGTFTYSPAAGAVPTAGTHTLSVTFTPTDTRSYNTAKATVSLTVNQATPTITWATPPGIVQGTALTGAQLDATANTAGTFTYSPALGSVMNSVGTFPLSTTFTPTDTTDFATTTATVQLVVMGAVVVDFGTQEQIIRGFGSSEAWYGPMSNAEMTALYGNGAGDLGLSIMRLRIAPAAWNSATQTADTTQWTTELGNAQAAQALGATIFASPWTAPASMKTNGSLNEGSLSTSSYADYAAYLEDYVQYATSQGVNLYAISMQNEPDWNPCDPNGIDEGPNGKDCYESDLWTGAQMDTWVAQNASVLTTKLMMPESFYFNAAMSDPALNDSNAVGKISIIGGHLYGSSPYNYANAVSMGKDVWETEHFLSAASGGTTTSIADALAMAEELHNSMAVAQYNAYVYWWPIDGASGAATGLVDPNFVPNYFGYAMEHFSRFVRPGYYRYNAPATPVAGVFLSAYGGNGHQVIVAINSTNAAVSLPIQIDNQTVTSMVPYQTTASIAVSQLSTIAVANSNFTATLPAQSITTYVQ
jgi:O-glycosyl hydrolase